jgi:hypothetical protein
MRPHMRGILVSSLVVASIALSGSVAGDAVAATLAPAPIMSDGNGPLVQRVTNVCGANGCVRVQTQRIQHHKPGSAAAKHI